MHVSKTVKISIGYKTQQNFTDQYQNDKMVFVRDRDCYRDGEALNILTFTSHKHQNKPLLFTS